MQHVGMSSVNSSRSMSFRQHLMLASSKSPDVSFRRPVKTGRDEYLDCNVNAGACPWKPVAFLHRLQAIQQGLPLHAQCFGRRPHPLSLQPAHQLSIECRPADRTHDAWSGMCAEPYTPRRLRMTHPLQKKSDMHRSGQKSPKGAKIRSAQNAVSPHLKDFWKIFGSGCFSSTSACLNFFGNTITLLACQHEDATQRSLELPLAGPGLRLREIKSSSGCMPTIVILKSHMDMFDGHLHRASHKDWVRIHSQS